MLRTATGAMPETLFSKLDELQIATTTFDHPPVYTSDQAREYCPEVEGEFCNTRIVKTKQEKMWLVVTLDATEINLKSLSHDLIQNDKIEGRLSLADSERMMDVLKVPPRLVTPFALINDVEQEVGIILDASILEYNMLNFHPLTNEKTTTIATSDLLTFIEACGHSPMIVDFEEIAAQAA